MNVFLLERSQRLGHRLLLRIRGQVGLRTRLKSSCELLRRRGLELERVRAGRRRSHGEKEERGRSLPLDRRSTAESVSKSLRER